MNIVIVGQGAIGLLWYCKLTEQSTNQVSLQCSSSVSKVPDCVSITKFSGQQNLVPLKPAGSFELDQADLVIFCLKAFDLIDGVVDTSKYVNAGIPLIFCHNGMVDLCKLPQKIKQQHPVLTMLMTHGSRREQAFNITHTGLGQTDLGLISGELPLEQQSVIVTTLNNALTEVHWRKNIIDNQWAKLTVNCIINPLTAINNIPNSGVLSGEYQEVKTLAVREVILIAKANNIILDEDSLIKKVDEVANLTATNCSSMRSDVLAKRKTEIDNINGFIHLLGLKYHIATPVNTRLWQQIKALELKHFN